MQTILDHFENSAYMDRETGSRSKLDKFHLKQTVQKIMHRFLELYQDFV